VATLGVPVSRDLNRFELDGRTSTKAQPDELPPACLVGKLGDANAMTAMPARYDAGLDSRSPDPRHGDDALTQTPIRSGERRRSARGTPMGEPSRSHLVAMIEATYREMPGLGVHLNQAARLFGLRNRTCEVVLEDLVREGRLRRAADGQYRAP
jgi:hypothetical protein